MTRLDENNELIEWISKTINECNGTKASVYTEKQIRDAIDISVFIDISKSLAVIADAMSCGENNDQKM